MFKSLKRSKLLIFIFVAIFSGILIGLNVSGVAIDMFVALGSMLSTFISFFVPLIVIAFVTQGIVSMESSSGKILGFTVVISYLFMFISAFAACFVGINFLGKFFSGGNISSLGILNNSQSQINIFSNLPKIEVKPIVEVIPAIIISFVVGFGINLAGCETLKKVVNDFYKIIEIFVRKVIVSILPFYVLCTFVKLAASGKMMTIVQTFYKVFLIIIVLHLLSIFLQFLLAGLVSKRNPFILLRNVIQLYLTCLATQSSVAMIPVALEAARKNGVSEGVCRFVIPLCSTIHLTGSIISITSCSIAVMNISGYPVNFSIMVPFILSLGIMMIAAPGVPCGAILAASSLFSSFLGFNPQMIALMIALHVCQDGFGTACNVTGDNAIALIVDKLFYKNKSEFFSKS
ncbi:MAG: dicarboxylate/amino acid:cation symporter [Oscillospiraceae bacterium]|nr:dicarboxylate/amino acid:cation symporter [Oscillospiraceae bacterium]